MAMKLDQSERARRWLALVFAMILALIALAAIWWRYDAPAAQPAPKSAAQASPPAAGTTAKAESMTLEALFASLAPDALAQGVSAATFQRATAGVSIDEDIAGLNASQPEHAKSAGDYIDLLVSETRIAGGRVRLAEHAALLTQLEARYGVDRHILMAIWGIESAYGTAMGERSVIRSLATLSATDARRAGFWRGELVAALQILERGDITAGTMTGSWAGAMGHTQFMPSTYLAHAADFDGDGRRDIWNPATPADALASAANYLRASGWTAGRPALIEVRLPPGFDHALATPAERKSLAEWLALGVAPVAPVTGEDDRWSLALPAGAKGPAFLSGANLRAILRYNNAVPYALAVAHLAGRLADGGPFATAWPADDRGLTRAEREELQQRLAARGHEVGGIDGIVGAATRAAIRAFQKERGLAVDGHANHALLEAVRGVAADRPRAP
jgi:membrane-bound lytic murein transglycosylase B